MYIIKKINMAYLGVLIVAAALPGVSSRAADGYASPAVIPGAVIIDAEQLITLVEHHPDVVLIDARVREDRADGYIEGSVNLVDVRTDCDSLARLLSGPATPVVFYCNGVACDRSTHAVRIALACGYREVYWFRGGVEEWRAKHYPLIEDVSQ
jgi:rhodanese-related sulfurtransferase